MKHPFALIAACVLVLASCASTKSSEPLTFDQVDKSGFRPCQKTAYEIQIRKTSKPLTVYNRFEDVTYDVKPEDGRVILTGTSGEEWLAKPEKVCKTYENLDGTPLTEDQIPVDTKLTVKTKIGTGTNFALFIPKKTKVIVQTSWGDTLKANRDGVPHGKGDYLMCTSKDGKPDFSDVWVVNGETFPQTYEFTK